MRKPPVAVRHVLSNRLAFASVGLTALLIAAFTALAVGFFGAVTAGAARGELTGSPGSAILVTATASRSNADATSATIAQQLREMLPSLNTKIELSAESNILNVPGHGAGAAKPTAALSGRVKPKPGVIRKKAGRTGAEVQTQLASIPRLAQHIVVLSGSCPGRAQQPISVCAPEVAARALGLSAGKKLTLRDSVTGQTVAVRISGIYRPIAPSDSFWTLDPLGAGSVQVNSGFKLVGPLVISPAAASKAGYEISTVSGLGVPDFGKLGGGRLASRRQSGG